MIFYLLEIVLMDLRASWAFLKCVIGQDVAKLAALTKSP